jgi:hypothetical protein
MGKLDQSLCPTDCIDKTTPRAMEVSRHISDHRVSSGSDIQRRACIQHGVWGLKPGKEVSVSCMLSLVP